MRNPAEQENPNIPSSVDSQKRSKKAVLEAALLSLLLGSVLLFVVYQLATTKLAPEERAMRKQIRFLSQELLDLSERLERSKARQAVLEQESTVLRKANRLLREGEIQQQAELSRLQTELDFYGRLAGTGGEQTGLAVYHVELSPSQSPRVFQYVLTLTQNIRRASIISGKVKIDLEGTIDDRPVTLFWSQLSAGSEAEPSFRFKYFQQLEGYLTLPEAFNPIRLVITLAVKDRREPVSRSIDWRDLLEEPIGELASDAPDSG